MLARIYRPSKTAMQSGRAKAANWVLEFEPSAARRPDPLMGWTVHQRHRVEPGAARPSTPRRRRCAYAEAHGIAFQLSDPAPAKRIIKAYADNFAFGRTDPWTH